MGVFAKLFRRSETTAAAEQAVNEPSASDVEATESAETETPETAEATEAGEATEAPEPGASEKDEENAEAAGIPHQQSAEAAADSEAGESAHT